MSPEKYDMKQAYNDKLTKSARFDYLKNAMHDEKEGISMRKGYAGQYTGNNHKITKHGISMYGSPAEKMDDDLKYMPVEDVAGQGTEGVNKSVTSLKSDMNMKKPMQKGVSMKAPMKMGHKSPAKMGHKSPAKMGHKSPAKMKGKVTFGRKS